MNNDTLLKAKTATRLLRVRDARRRRKLMLAYSVALLLLFLAHSYLTNLSSPLKLIPQTFCAAAMGYVLLTILSLRHFKHLAEFIDWQKAADFAEPKVKPTTEHG